MRDWIFWTIVVTEFVFLVSIYNAAIIIQGQVRVLHDLVQTLRNTPRD